MRLDLGPDGKIIGTRRVSPNGQVSGLSEFSGREVLVILPGTSDSPSSMAWPNPDEVVRLVNEQIRDAYERYRVLQETYATPWEATRSFIEGMFRGPAPDFLAEVDRWVQRQTHSAEPTVEPDTRSRRDSASSAAPRATPRSTPKPSRAPRRKRA